MKAILLTLACLFFLTACQDSSQTQTATPPQETKEVLEQTPTAAAGEQPDQEAEDNDMGQKSDWKNLLSGQEFALQTFDGEEVSVENEERRPSLSFAEWPRIAGRMCNNFTGPVEETEDALLKAANLATTRMMCLDEKISTLENAFHEMLREGASVELADNGTVLTLTGQGHTLVFTIKAGEGESAAKSQLETMLAHHNYILENFDGTEVKTEEKTRQPHLSFGQWPHVNGRMCNSFRGPITADGMQLKAPQMAATLMACPEESINKLEGTFFQAMAEGVEVSISEDKQTLTLTGGGHSFVFRLSDYVQ